MAQVFYKNKAAMGSNKHGCFEEENGDLICLSPREPNKWNSNPIQRTTIKNPFNRIAYHLFSSIMQAEVSKVFKDVPLEPAISSNLVLGELYRRILGYQGDAGAAA